MADEGKKILHFIFSVARKFVIEKQIINNKLSVHILISFHIFIEWQNLFDVLLNSTTFRNYHFALKYAQTRM